MDNNEQTVTAKQQLLELLRNANSVVITTGANPGADDIAAAIGLRMLLEKLEKVVEVVSSAPVPERVKFLPVDSIHDKVLGQRDFIVSIDQSRAEADHLKYDIIDGKIKLFVTPYSGRFTEHDVSYSYGDYHCDAVIGLGVQSVGQLDKAVTSDQQLLKKAQLLLINPGQVSNDQTAVSWSDNTSSSVCEMIMSISEALGSGLLDEQVATALFTGILEKTHHFTNSSTTPKVMTMAAQLLAAGARQADVVKNLSKPEKPPEQPKKVETNSKEDDSKKTDDKKNDNKDNEDKKEKPKEPETPPNELQVRKRKTMQSPPQASPKSNEAEEKPVNTPGQDKHNSQPGPVGHGQPNATPANSPSDKVESMQIPTLPPEPPQTPNAQKPAVVPPAAPNPQSVPQSPYPRTTLGDDQSRPQDYPNTTGGIAQSGHSDGQQKDFKPQQQPTHSQPVPKPQTPPQPPRAQPVPKPQTTNQPPVNTPAGNPPQQPSSSPPPNTAQGSAATADLEAARRAVEEAAGGDTGNQQQ